jgi:hypothetical protein
MVGKSKHCCAVIYHSFREFGTDAFHIELIEQIEYTDRCELLQLENRYISELDCVNKQAAYTGLSKLEYNKQYNKQYKEANRDAILEKAKQKHDCECGGRFTAAHKAAHLKSKKHKDYLNSI